MSFESALAAHLKDAVTISAIVGTDVYKTMCDNPEAGKARIEIVMDGGGGHTKHSTGVATLTHRTGRILCREASIKLAELLQGAVRKVLDGFVQSVLGSGGNTAAVSRLSLRAPIDDYVAPIGGSDAGHPTRTIAFEAWLKESI